MLGSLEDFVLDLGMRRAEPSCTATTPSPTKRCRYLFDRGYLFKREAHMDEPDICYLRTRGRHYIAKTFGLDREHVRKVAGVSGTGSDPSLYMEHDLTLSKLYGRPPRVWSPGLGVSMQKHADALEPDGFEPDAWIRVANDGRAKEAFLEFTGRRPWPTSSPTALRPTLAIGRSRARELPVLWFTTSRAKANWLFDKISRHRYADYLLVALIENKRNFLTAPIWRWVKSQEPICSLKPPTVL